MFRFRCHTLNIPIEIYHFRAKCKNYISIVRSPDGRMR